MENCSNNALLKGATIVSHNRLCLTPESLVKITSLSALLKLIL